MDDAATRPPRGPAATDLALRNASVCPDDSWRCRASSSELPSEKSLVKTSTTQGLWLYT
jgi:hypothetical protein